MRRADCVFICMVLAACARVAHATFAPPHPVSPQQMLADWNQRCGGWTVDHCMEIFDAHTPDQKVLARGLSTLTIAQTQLQQAAFIKYGRAGEIAIARAMRNDTPTDDLAAHQEIDGVTATLTFAPDVGIGSYRFLFVDGRWKIDAQQFGPLGGNADKFEARIDAQVQAIHSIIAVLQAGRYASVEEMANDLQSKMRATYQ